MPVSMTGFGRGEAAGQGIKVVAELGTVNRKQFDCHVNLPREFAAFEGRDKGLLLSLVMMDPFTKSEKQARGLLDEILSLPVNREMRDWYR